MRRVGWAVLAMMMGACAATKGTAAVTVTRLSQPLSPSAVPPTSFNDELMKLQFDLLEHPNVKGEPKQFGLALQAITEGELEKASTLLTLLCDSEDEGVRTLARSFLMNLLYHAEDYAGMAERRSSWGDTMVDYELALQALPVSTHETQDAVSDALIRGPFDLPVLSVRVNHQPEAWLWDTGASFTVVTEGAVSELGVRVLGEGLDIGTSTSQDVAARFGVLPLLEVGNVVFRDLAVLVLPDEALQWEAPDGEIGNIRAIVGWNAIRHVRTELDFEGGTYRMELPGPRTYPVRNAFWLGYPIVRLQGPQGQPLAFGYDSGSVNSSMSKHFSESVALGHTRKKRIGTGGAAGVEVTRTRVADSMPLVISGYRFDVRDAVEEDQTNVPFVTIHGLLGSDVAQSCTVTFDMPNGFYGMDCPAAVE